MEKGDWTVTPHGEDGGPAHLNIGVPPEPDEKIDYVWVLVIIHPGGGEGIYGQVMQGQPMNLMLPFIFQDDYMKEQYEKLLRDKGTLEVLRRDKKRVEWRRFGTVAEVDVLVDGP